MILSRRLLSRLSIASASACLSAAFALSPAAACAQSAATPASSIAQQTTPRSTQTQGTAPPEGFAQTLRLWPGAAPLATGAADEDVPKLFSYPASGAGPHPAVIVMPGGGYTHLVMGKEGSSEARWLNARGVSAFVLEYRLAPRYHYPAPMLDGARAVRYLRANAATLGVDPRRVGVWGFSAGAHLSAFLATVGEAELKEPGAPDAVDRESCHPDFAILSYGRYTMTAEVPRPAPTAAAPGMEIVLGATTAQLDLTSRVTPANSPSFLYSTSNDQTVDSRNATTFYNALKASRVPVELHIFERGPHGTGIAENLAPDLSELTIYPELLAHWMRQNGWMPASLDTAR